MSNANYIDNLMKYWLEQIKESTIDLNVSYNDIDKIFEGFGFSIENYQILINSRTIKKETEEITSSWEVNTRGIKETENFYNNLKDFLSKSSEVELHNQLLKYTNY